MIRREGSRNHLEDVESYQIDDTDARSIGFLYRDGCSVSISDGVRNRELSAFRTVMTNSFITVIRPVGTAINDSSRKWLSFKTNPLTHGPLD